MNPDELEKAREASRKLGKLGGETTKKKYGVEHYKRISEMGIAKIKLNKRLRELEKLSLQNEK